MQRFAMILLACGLAGLILMTGCATGSEGQQKTEKLSSNILQFDENTNKAKEEIDTTLAAYNKLINGEAEDAKATYSTYAKGVDDIEKRAQKISDNIAAMNETASAFFALWDQKMAEIQSESTRAAAKQRKDKVQAHFKKIDKEAKEASKTFDPFMTQLKDQRVMLGMELSKDALAALKEDAKKLNEAGKALIKEIDEVRAAAMGFVDAVRPQESAQEEPAEKTEETK